MAMYKLEIKLMQHTPLIHFQPGQEMATLRASEVKPLLDKFVLDYLIKKIGDDNYETISDQEFEDLIAQYEKEHYPNKFDDLTTGNSQADEIGKLIAYKNGIIKKTSNRPALDYKLIIIPNERIDEIRMKEMPEKDDPLTGQKIYKTPDYPSKKNIIILGNIGGKPKDELLNFTQHKSIEIQIKSKHKDIVTTIENNIERFFLQNNFQNRKYRGFGSFTVTSINGKPVLTTVKPRNLLATLSFEISRKNGLSTWKGIEIVFSSIGAMWNILRNNEHNREQKGLIKVFLGVNNTLSNNEERIPSPIFFKPIIDKSSNNWKTTIYILPNEEVIKASECNVEDFKVLIKDNVESIKKNIKKISDDSLEIKGVNIKVE